MAGSPPQLAPSDAARFLTQASFGPTDSSISDVQSAGYAGWIANQEAMPPSASHQAFVEARLAELRVTNPSAVASPPLFYDSFWAQAVTAPDQLRQRVKLALSEIFVISLYNHAIDVRGAASFYDMLGRNAFGNYRTLLEQVTLHPTMGVYLSALANVKENLITGQHPDENYAREVMQLMSIGVYQLNQDGSRKLDGTGAPIPNYSSTDIQGLARVFTGFSWYSANPTITGYKSTFYGYVNKDPNANIVNMIAYPSLHSTGPKMFLGTTIPPSSTPDPAGDLKVALDTIFNNPNVGPFIGKQLIQRLVTSNPSPGYISRVAAVFNDNGAGVRGDLGAVARAILLDPEARDPAAVSSPTFGKLREPVVRAANWMRAFNASSSSGRWLIGDSGDPKSLDQSTLDAPAVFNFWRPGYSPPETTLGGLNLVAPEFQRVNEASVAGYLNTMRLVVSLGMGTLTAGVPDVRSAYVNELAIANNAANLVARVNLLLLYGQMSPGLTGKIVDSVNSISIPGAGATQAQINAALNNRIYLAIYLAMSSPEYLAQR